MSKIKGVGADRSHPHAPYRPGTTRNLEKVDITGSVCPDCDTNLKEWWFGRFGMTAVREVHGGLDLHGSTSPGRICRKRRGGKTTPLLADRKPIMWRYLQRPSMAFDVAASLISDEFRHDEATSERSRRSRRRVFLSEPREPMRRGRGGSVRCRPAGDSPESLRTQFPGPDRRSRDW